MKSALNPVGTMVDYRILGTLEVATDGRLADLGPPKQRELLALLVLHANEVMSVDRLIDGLWGDDPPRRAGHAIQVYVSRLREALRPLTGAETIVWRAPGYLLAAPPTAVDARRVEGLVADGARHLEAGELQPAAAVLGRARAAWRGPALADFAYEEFAQPHIRRLTELWLHATELHATAELELGRGEAALALAREAINEDPLREAVREIELLALYRAGRAAEAIRSYEAFRRLLADELGVEPTRALRHLAERILVHDPELRPADATTTAASAVNVRNPYKGLRAFSEEDAADFFGRAALLDDLLGGVAAGSRLVALVGPSGSGKSSVLDAGLVPALRSGQVVDLAGCYVARVRTDRRPLEELAVATAAATGGETLVLVADQLEQLFLTASDDECNRFMADLARLATDESGTRVILALRADFYDRPLTNPDFAPVFLAGVVHILPMTTSELEAAIVEPAARVGVQVEPALLAELIADALGQPGTLPQLGHVLATLFEACTDDALRLDAYRALGGLRGALGRRAENVFGALDEAGQDAARQVLLRLVRPGIQGRDASRRSTVHELTEIESDPVVLSATLRAFEAERLLTFDRDPTTGDATVEVAHEALFAAWDRLARWIEEHRLDLRRHAWLEARVSEWLASGRADEDLLTGRRLEEYGSWRAETTLGLTAAERALLDASHRRRREEQASAATREEHVRSLQRRARLRLLGFAGAAVALLATIAYALLAWPGAAPDIVLVFPGTDRGGMYASISQGFDQATSELDLDVQTIVQDPGDSEQGWPDLEARLRRLADQGVDLIVVGFAWSNPQVHRVAADHPETLFLAVDYHGDLPNVSAPKFRAEEGAYLVGAAAALRTETGTVGIVTESDSDIEWPYVAGFEAGARAVDPNVEVIVSYGYDPFTEPIPELTVVDVSRAVREVYRAGADVVFYSGEQSAIGVFDAAYRESQATRRHHWAVAREADWYAVLPLFSADGGADVSAWRSHVLTSLITRWDIGISTMLDDYLRQELRSGERWFGLADGGYDLSPSGGAIDDILPQLMFLAERIASGEIVVPADPPDRGPVGRVIEPMLSGALERGIGRAEWPGERRQMP